MAKNVQRDLVAPFVFGYYSQFWFGKIPGPDKPTPDQIVSHGDLLCQREIGNGIFAAAFENGSILFDFSKCEDTPIIIHRESLRNTDDSEEHRRKIGTRLSRTESRQSTNQSYYRTILIAHVLLLENAARQEEGRAMNLPKIETLYDAIACHALAKAHPYRLPHKFNSCLTKKTIDRSFDDLSCAIGEGGNVVRSLELLKLSHYRHFDRRSAESIVLSWTICESLIDYLWRAMIKEIKASDKDRMTKNRIKNLSNPSAFTAAVKTETLELSGIISTLQANSLNFVRKKRNDWLHALKDITPADAKNAIQVCEDLISSIHNISIDMSIGMPGGSGGGMFMDVFEKRFPDFDFGAAYDG